MSIPLITLSKYASEVRSFGFDFQDFPEVQQDETLSSPSVSVSPSGPTIGSPSVTDADFYPGNGARMIPAGEGVKVSISGGTASTTYTLTCTVTTSGGATLIMKGTLVVE